MKRTKKSSNKNMNVSRMTEKDIIFILYELDSWQNGERSNKLTWDVLERLSGYSRQSLWAKPEIKIRYQEVKANIRNGIKKPTSNQYRQTLEQRIKSLEDQIAKFKEQENKWLELWARYEYNAQVIGISSAELSKPLPKINR
jgi:hypothetical protein